MTPIPTKIRKQIAADPAYKRCMLEGIHQHICGGRITMEHALIYGGRQIQEKWAIISLCARGHEVDQYQDAGTMVKELNQWVALNRASEEELASYPKAAFKFLKDRLNRKFGVYIPSTPEAAPEIDYGLIGI